MFQHKLKRYNAHVVAYKDYLNQSKQRQRDYHICWFKEIQLKLKAEKNNLETIKKNEEYIKNIMNDRNITNVILLALPLSMRI